MSRRPEWVACALGILLLGRGAAVAEPMEQGAVATLPALSGHEVWVTDRLLAHSLLLDGDKGEVLAMVDAGATITPKPPLHSPERGEFYSVEIAYERFRRGERIDYVTIYDSKTLEVKGEVVLPTRTAESNTSFAHAALLDGGRFLGVFNQFPNTSVSVVDLESRSFAGEVIVTGCAGVYPVGPARFAMLCGDGSMVVVVLDGAGKKGALVRGEPFFDPVADPAFMQGVRIGSRWIFVTFAGQVHEVDFSQGAPVMAEPWSLFGDASVLEGWRIGGLQHVGVHEGTNRLFMVAHEGEAGSHKAPGREVWVYDLATKQRVSTFPMPNLAAAFLAATMDLDEDGLASWILERIVPNQGVHSIALTRDDAPLLFVRNAELGAVAVLDAVTGEHLRNITELGLAGPSLEVP
jgi:methylamine dehydrogenase heavy chain